MNVREVRMRTLASQCDVRERRGERFSLLEVTSPFTYTVTAPRVFGSYTFSGVIKDSDRNDTSVGGASGIRVATSPPLHPPATAAPPPPATPVPSVPDNPRLMFVGGIEQERSGKEGSAEGADVDEPVTATGRNSDAVTYSMSGNDANFFA